jgi:hypothetical protein
MRLLSAFAHACLASAHSAGTGEPATQTCTCGLWPDTVCSGTRLLSTRELWKSVANSFPTHVLLYDVDWRVRTEHSWQPTLSGFRSTGTTSSVHSVWNSEKWSLTTVILVLEIYRRNHTFEWLLCAVNPFKYVREPFLYSVIGLLKMCRSVQTLRIIIIIIIIIIIVKHRNFVVNVRFFSMLFTVCLYGTQETERCDGTDNIMKR